MLRRVGTLTALAMIASCSKSEVKPTGVGTATGAGPPATRPTFTVFAVAEVRGQIGPCGCTTDPLGDISRTTQLVAQARAAGPVMFVDAGSLLYSKLPIPAHLAVQEDLKANLLAETYLGALKVDALGLGPADLARGADQLRLPRLAQNAVGIVAAPPKLLEVGGAKVGVFGVIAEGAVTGLTLTDPVAAGKQAVARLRGEGAQVVIGLIQAASKTDAVRIVRDIGGIDLAVAGLGLATPEPDEIELEPRRIGESWLVMPANRGQIVARLDVTVRGSGPLLDAIGPSAAEARRAVLEQRLRAIDADLAAFAKDPSADRAFVAQHQRERAQLAADRDQLKAQPLVVPPRGSYFTLTQVRINKALACEPGVQDAVSAFFRATGEANVKAAAKLAVAVPAKGQASYVGTEACTECHADQVASWQKTAHATAWKTLVDRGQQFDYDCIGCHVTGWDKPGGSNLGHNDKLRNVQCETCHGPGSIHVASSGLETPASIKLAPAPGLCATQCHTKEHSDTFQLEPYLRDVVGPGHGEARRKQLGEGPTGAQLRKAGIAKAGSKLGAGCTR
jgi:cytochrome c5